MFRTYRGSSQLRNIGTPCLHVLLLWAGVASCSSSGGAPDDMRLGSPGETLDLGSSSPIVVTVSVDGDGQVTSTPAGIDCPTTCTARFPPGTQLKLTAQPGLRQYFSTWTGACGGSNAVCIPTPAPNVTLEAQFAARQCSPDNWCIEQPLPMGIGSLSRVWGSAVNDVWAVGDDGTFLHYTGVQWYQVDAMTSQSMYGLWGSAANDVWVVGSGQAILHFDGTSWTLVGSEALANLFPLWGSSANDIWTYGGGPFSGTYFLHYDGMTWNKVSTTLTATLYGLWGSDMTDVWSVGSSGTILHFDGGMWQAVPSGITANLNDVFGTSATDAWTVGDSGTLLHFNGMSWEPVDISGGALSVSLRGVWASAEDSAWIVGDGGTLLHFDGTNVTPATSGILTNLRGVWGSDANDIWAVGDAGILRYLP